MQTETLIESSGIFAEAYGLFFKLGTSWIFIIIPLNEMAG